MYQVGINKGIVSHCIYSFLGEITVNFTELLYNHNVLGGYISKVKVTLVQALRLCTGGTAHRGSRGIALLFHDQRH